MTFPQKCFLSHFSLYLWSEKLLELGRIFPQSMFSFKNADELKLKLFVAICFDKCLLRLFLCFKARFLEVSFQTWLVHSGLAVTVLPWGQGDLMSDPGLMWFEGQMWAQVSWRNFICYFQTLERVTARWKELCSTSVSFCATSPQSSL